MKTRRKIAAEIIKNKTWGKDRDPYFKRKNKKLRVELRNTLK